MRLVLPGLLVAKFLCDNFPQFDTKSVRDPLGKIRMRITSEHFDVRHFGGIYAGPRWNEETRLGEMFGCCFHATAQMRALNDPQLMTARTLH